MIVSFLHHFCAAGAAVQSGPDFHKDGILSISPLVIPKPQFLNAHGCKEFFSRVGMTSLLRGSVFKAVQFDRQPGCGTKEVENVFPNGMLAPKFKSRKPSGAQGTPKLFFFLSLFTPKSPGVAHGAHALENKQSMIKDKLTSWWESNLLGKSRAAPPLPGPLPHKWRRGRRTLSKLMLPTVNIEFMKRVVEPEWLDELPADDPAAARSRRDLRRLNRVMGHGTILRGLLESAMDGREPKRIVELGAGDGTLMLSLAKYFAPRWQRVEVTLVDCKDVVTDATRKGFAALGWPVDVVTTDIFDWLAKPAETADAMMANLFLHQFPERQLGELLRLAVGRTKALAACEPRRGRLPLTFSRMVRLIGCNAVTRHDAALSVQAGFAGRELSALWPEKQQWNLREGSAKLFSHAFLAERKEK